MTDNILRMPYAVVPREWIDKLIQNGVLRASRRHDARAVENALLVLRQRSRKILDIDEAPPPAK